MQTLENQYPKLTEWFQAFEQVVVAFSGGVDSTLLLKAAVDGIGSEHLTAVIADSPSLPREELANARELAAGLGVELLSVSTRELAQTSYVANQGDRCYFCKKELFREILKAISTDERISSRDGNCALSPQQPVVVDGTNHDDLSDVRPGRKAAEEFGVRHPFAELGIGKEEIRSLSRLHGLPTWNKPEMACLASRIPTGLRVTRQRLSMVERAERELRNIGFKHFRVRYHKLAEEGAQHSDPTYKPALLARIEFGEEDLANVLDPSLREKMIRAIKESGFTYVSIDAEGYRKSGLPRG